MFKPTLKRSKLSQHEESTPYKKYYTENHINKLTAPANYKSKLSIAPSVLLQPRNDHQNENTNTNVKIVTPLNSWSLMYPEQVKKGLDMSMDQIDSRGIGCKYGTYWLHIDKNLHFWTYESAVQPSKLKAQRNFNFEYSIRTIAIGIININSRNSYTMDLNENDLVLAIGFQKFIDMFLIDKQTLEIKNLNLKFRVDYNQSLQKIVFTQHNEILYTGSEGYLARIIFFPPPQSFNRGQSPKSITKFAPKPSSLSISSSSFFYKSKTVITEQIVTSLYTNKIYVLLREELDYSWMQNKWRKLKNYLSGRKRTSFGTRFIQKHISVYSIGNGQTLYLQGIIKDSQIQENLLENYVHTKITNQINGFQIIQDDDQKIKNTLISISLSPQKHQSSRFYEYQTKQRKDLLSVSTKSRHFITLKQHFSPETKKFSFNFIEEPLRLPDFLQTYQQEQEEGFGICQIYNSEEIQNEQNSNTNNTFYARNSQRKITVLEYSLGYNNLNFLSNGLCYYINDEQIQVIKYDITPQTITQMSISNVNQWVLFSNDSINVVKLMSVPEMLLAYMCAQQQISQIKILEMNQNKMKMKQMLSERQLDAKIQHQYVLMSCHSLLNIFAKISNIISRKRLCQGICELLVYITGKKMDFRSFFNFIQKQKDAPMLFDSDGLDWKSIQINRHIKQMAKVEIEQEEEKRQKKNNYLGRAYSSGQTKYLNNVLKFKDWFYYIFKQNQSVSLTLNHRTQKILWRLLVVYQHLTDQNLSNANQRMHSLINKKNAGYGSYWIFLVQSLTKIFKQIKDWCVQDFSKQSIIKQAYKQKLKIIQQFLKQKQKQSEYSHRDIKYLRQRLREQEKHRIKIAEKDSTTNAFNVNKDSSFSTRSESLTNNYEDDLRGQLYNGRKNKKIQSLNSNQSQNINQQSKNHLKINHIDQSFKINLESAESVQNLEEKIKQFIPKVLISIQLFEILGQRKDRQLPSFGKFILELSARKQIKKALIHTFPNKQLHSNQVITKFNKFLPQLGLQQELLFQKWFGQKLKQNPKTYQTRNNQHDSFLNIGNIFTHKVNQKVTQRNQNEQISNYYARNLKIQDYDYQKIAHKFEYQKLKQLKELFSKCPQKYIQLLSHRQRSIYFDLETIQNANEILLGSHKKKQSILEIDSENLSKQIEKQLQNERNQLRKDINQQIQNLALRAHQSRGEQYLYQQKCLDECVQFLFKHQWTQIFLQDLTQYLNKKDIWIEKVHKIIKRLGILKKRQQVSSMTIETKRPDLMPTLELISSNFSKKNDSSYYSQALLLNNSTMGTLSSQQVRF